MAHDLEAARHVVEASVTSSLKGAAQTTLTKYACRTCQDVIGQAPALVRLVEGGIPNQASVDHMLVSKYADHLPLYRLAQIYAQQGVNLDRSTLAGWVGKAAFLRWPGSHAPIAFYLYHPVAQRLARATDLGRDRADRA